MRTPPNELAYWSGDTPERHQLRLDCRRALQSFGEGKHYGSALMPLIGCTVILRARIHGRIVQAFRDRVGVVINEGTPQSRCLFLDPQEVMLPWHPDHQPAFRNERRPSSTPSSGSSRRRPAATAAKPTAAPTVAPAGPMSLPL